MFVASKDIPIMCVKHAWDEWELEKHRPWIDEILSNLIFPKPHNRFTDTRIVAT